LPQGTKIELSGECRIGGCDTNHGLIDRRGLQSPTHNTRQRCDAKAIHSTKSVTGPSRQKAAKEPRAEEDAVGRTNDGIRMAVCWFRGITLEPQGGVESRLPKSESNDGKGESREEGAKGSEQDNLSRHGQ